MVNAGTIVASCRLHVLRWNRRAAMLTLCLALPSFLALPSSQALAADACSKLVISGDPAYPPLSWYDGSVMRGAAVDIVTTVLDRLHIAYEKRYAGPFLRVLNEAKIGHVDIIVELKDTPDRRAYLDYAATPIFVNPVAVFASKQHPLKYTQWTDLVGLNGGRTLGNKFGGGFDEFLASRLKVEEASEIALNFDKLAAGRIDYFVSSYYPALSYLLQQHREAEFDAMQPFVTANDNFVGWSKASTCLPQLDAFNAVLVKMAQSGELKRIVDASLSAYRTSPDRPAF